MKPFLQLLESTGSCDELLSCLFGLNALESELYFTLVLGKVKNVKELAALVGKEQSVVYRACQKLASHGLCLKEKQLLKKGGYFFVYSARDPAVVKEEILARFARTREHLEQMLNDFEGKVSCRKKELARLKKKKNPEENLLPESKKAC